MNASPPPASLASTTRIFGLFTSCFRQRRADSFVRAILCFDDDAGGNGKRSSGRATVSGNSTDDDSSGNGGSCDSDSRAAWCRDGARWKRRRRRRERQSSDGGDDGSDDGSSRRVACDCGTWGRHVDGSQGLAATKAQTIVLIIYPEYCIAGSYGVCTLWLWQITSADCQHCALLLLSRAS